MYIGNVHPSEFYKDKPEVLNRFNDFMKKEGIEYSNIADECSLPKRFHIFGSCCGSGGTRCYDTLCNSVIFNDL